MIRLRVQKIQPKTIRPNKKADISAKNQRYISAKRYFGQIDQSNRAQKASFEAKFKDNPVHMKTDFTHAPITYMGKRVFSWLPEPYKNNNLTRVFFQKIPK